MKGLYFNGKSLSLQELPEKEPGPGEALVRVLFAGICRTDLEILKGYFSFSGIPGHEFVGVVERASQPELLGKRVVGEINIGCGKCPACLSDDPRHCPNRKVLGIYKKDGAFAEFLTLPEKNLLLYPEELPLQWGPFVEPLAAAMEIFENTEIEPAEPVLVIGDGKLAQLIVRVLLLHGCEVHVLGHHREKLQLLQKRGALIYSEPSELKGSFPLVVEATGNPQGYLIALERVRPRGKIILKSTYVGDAKLMAAQVVVNEVQIIGSRCGRFAPALSLMQRCDLGLDELITAIYPLEKFEEAFRKAGERGSLKVLLEIGH